MDKTSTTEFVSNERDLTSAFSADDLEIEWITETGCVWSYPNRQLTKGINNEDKVDEPSEELEREKHLKNEFGVGEDRLKEIKISLKEAPGTEKQTSTWKLNDKQWTDKQRIDMTYSAFLAVFATLQTDTQGDEAAENLFKQQLGCPDKGQIQLSNGPHNDEEESEAKKSKKEKKGGKVFSILAGKINEIHKKFIVYLQDRIEDLAEAHSVEDSDVVLIFCPVVSRAGTDIDAALAKIQYPTDSKLTVLVVLHHTFDPEKTVSDSSKCVNKENLLTVDCLFYEDTGLLHCQRNSDAYDKSVNWLIQQGHTVGSSFQHKIHSSLPRLQMPSWFWRKKQETSGDNKKGFFCK